MRTRKKAKTKPSKETVLTNNEVDKMFSKLMKEFGFIPKPKKLKLPLPDPGNLTALSVRTIAQGIIREFFKEQVAAVVNDILAVTHDYPIQVIAKALETVLLSGVRALGEEEAKALEQHLDRFHAEISLLNGVDKPSATIH